MPIEASIRYLWRRQLDAYRGVNGMPIEASIGYLWRCQLDACGDVNWMPMEASIGCLQRRQLDAYRGVNWMPIEASIGCLWKRQLDVYSQRRSGLPINKVRISTGNRTQTLDTVYKRWRNGCLWKHQLDSYRGINWMLMEVSIGCLWSAAIRYGT